MAKSVRNNRSPVPVSGGEAALWRGAGARWRQLFGDFNRLGVSFEWHEIPAEKEVDWAPSFHPDSLELCLNLSGTGDVSAPAGRLKLGPWTAGFYRQGRTGLIARRLKGDEHQFITVELSPDFLSRHLRNALPDLHPLVRQMVEGTLDDSSVGVTEPINSRQRELVMSLRQPPVLASAQAVWYQAKAVELMGEFFFQPVSAQELFCHRQQRVARDRVDSVISLLKQNLTSPPPLEEIGRQVGCSPFYLSRTFSKETGSSAGRFRRKPVQPFLNIYASCDWSGRRNCSVRATTM